jgi:nondiscriminating glutamyl-tRNA synthetase
VPERVRFSPAPTGLLHLGGARTALFNDLIARQGGAFVLRFEDTDAQRADVAFEAGLLEDLAWIGLRWTEGPDIGGPFGPYRQSERTEVYAAALQRLAVAGRVYRCFCDESALARDRDADVAEGRAPRYRGTCRTIAPADAERRASAGEPFCWRFAVEPGREVAFDDLVHGTVVFASDDIGDFVVARADGAVLYDLACAVDDAAMAISLVIRGDDHLSNTPRQVMLLEAMGADVPRYAHVPLVLGEDGRPLSKSRGAESVAALRAEGYLASAIVNHLALLSWSDPQGREVLTPAEIAAVFSLDRVSPSAPVHDPARLRWLNRKHMAALPLDERTALVAACVPPLPGVDATSAAALIVDDVEVAGDAAALVAGVACPLEPDAEAVAALAAPAARRALQIAVAVLAAATDGVAAGDAAVAGDALRAALKEAGLAPRDALPAVRTALTGRAHGLPIATLLRLIGLDAARRRLELARDA